MSCFEYDKLRGKIREVYGTQAGFAEAIGLSVTSVSKKLNNDVDWKQEEIAKAVEALGLQGADIHAYFFAKKVEKNTTS